MKKIYSEGFFMSTPTSSLGSTPPNSSLIDDFELIENPNAPENAPEVEEISNIEMVADASPDLPKQPVQEKPENSANDSIEEDDLPPKRCRFLCFRC